MGMVGRVYCIPHKGLCISKHLVINGSPEPLVSVIFLDNTPNLGFIPITDHDDSFHSMSYGVGSPLS